jgi:23S rRNA (cytosine1962-C5)-methyltransferase
VIGEPPSEVSFLESGLTFTAEPGAGQKTGFYCDQRDNRRRAERLAGGRSLLDLFAHTGAFGVYARRGGAGRIVHVESSARLIEQGRRAYRANGFGTDAAEWHEANVFEWLRQPAGEAAEGNDEMGFGLVVVDPPPLVARRSDLDRGARAYKDVNRLALRRAAPGAFYLTFSCSAAVDARLFRQILFSASREARVRLQLLAPLAAAPDHPVAATHPEGEYLKGWLCRVVGKL